jgi:hypothetical protein
MSKYKLGLLVSTLCLINLGTVSPVSASSESIIVSQQSQQTVRKPNNGESMTQVQQSFGEPVERAAAVGEPPITRWRYAEFTVYFEHDRVIHAVAHRS